MMQLNTFDPQTTGLASYPFTPGYEASTEYIVTQEWDKTATDLFVYKHLYRTCKLD